MKKTILLLFLIACFIHVNAQSDSCKHQRIIYAELFGNSDIYSFNLEYLFKKNQSISCGISWLPGTWQISSPNDRAFWNLPISYHYLIGKTNHKLDMNAGFIATIAQNNDAPNNYKLKTQIGIGYRYQRTKGLFLRTGVTLKTPFNLSVDKDEMFFYSDKRWFLWPSFCVGWLF